jgi:hypothetical protein
MTIQEAISRHLAGHAPLTTLLGGSYIYWPALIAAPDAVPERYVAFQRVRLAREDRNVALSAATLLRATVRVTSWAGSDIETAQAIADEVSTRLDLFKGLMGGASGVQIQSCEMTDERDHIDAQVGSIGVVQDFDIVFTA